MKTIRESFENGEYAHWIKSFQRKNPDTISFSNSIDTINKGCIRLVSLNPIKIETSEISSNDFEQLGVLNEYFDYICSRANIVGVNSIVISIGGTLYSLNKDNENGEEFIRVIDINDESDTKSIIVVA